MKTIHLSTQLTYQSLRSFQYTILLRRKILWAIVLIYLFLVFGFSISYFSTGQVNTGFVYVTIGICFIAFLFALIQWRIHKAWSSYKVGQNATITYDFTDQDFHVKSPIGESTITYDKLYRIIETKTHFYLMISVNQGFIVPKADCPTQLVDLFKSLQNKP